MNYLVGKKIRLVKFTDRYITAEYIGWLNNHNITRYLCTGRMPVSKESLFAPTDNKNLMFAVLYTEGDSNKYIGTCSLHSIDWISRKGECGYMIGDSDFWGKGIATEIVGLLSDYAFNRLGLGKVTAGAVDGNTGSCKALEKNGFTKLCENPRDYYLEGKFLSTHMYYKLK